MLVPTSYVCCTWKRTCVPLYLSHRFKNCEFLFGFVANKLRLMIYDLSKWVLVSGGNRTVLDAISSPGHNVLSGHVTPKKVPA